MQEKEGGNKGCWMIFIRPQKYKVEKKLIYNFFIEREREKRKKVWLGANKKQREKSVKVCREQKLARLQKEKKNTHLSFLFF